MEIPQRKEKKKTSWNGQRVRRASFYTTISLIELASKCFM